MMTIILLHRHTVQPTIYDQVPMPHFLLPSKIFFFEPCIWVLKTKHIHKKVLVYSMYWHQHHHRELQRQNYFKETYIFDRAEATYLVVQVEIWVIGHKSKNQATILDQVILLEERRIQNGWCWKATTTTCLCSVGNLCVKAQGTIRGD